LLALRREAEAHGQPGIGQDLLVVPEPEEDSGVTFYAVRDDGVYEVEIFLDDRLVIELCEYELATWQGVIEYIDDDLQNGCT
jgi:hypothetical protein